MKKGFGGEGVGWWMNIEGRYQGSKSGSRLGWYRRWCGDKARGEDRDNIGGGVESRCLGFWYGWMGESGEKTRIVIERSCFISEAAQSTSQEKGFG